MARVEIEMPDSPEGRKWDDCPGAVLLVKTGVFCAHHRDWVYYRIGGDFYMMAQNYLPILVPVVARNGLYVPAPTDTRVTIYGGEQQ